jgi:APA family basic amino acid/polyamine antiporter
VTEFDGTGQPGLPSGMRSRAGLAGPRRPLPGSPVAATAGVQEHGGGLERVLGVPALFSAGYGNVGSSIYYALGLVAGFALGLTPIAFIVSGIIFVFTALTYAEATASYPEAGGSSSFARHAFNELASFTTAWAQMLNYVITMAISAYFVPRYLGVLWEPLKSSPWDVIGGVITILILATLNTIGVKETAVVTVTLALADFGTQVLLAILGLFLLFSPEILISNVDLGVAPTWSNFILGISVSMIAYTGIETISNMAEETRDPVKAVPRAIGWVVFAVISLYTILPLVALSALPVTQDGNGTYQTLLGLSEEDGGFASDPLLGLVQQFSLPAEWMAQALNYYVGVLAAIILFLATNAGMIGISRLSYSMSQYRQLPERLRHLHARFRSPYIGIWVFSIVAAIMLLPPALGIISGARQNAVLANLYAFGAMLSFSIAHLAVLRMRWRGDTPAWRAPMNLRIGTRSIPVFAVLGFLGTGTAWAVQVARNPLERWIGIGWMIVGPLIYYAYRRSQGLTLTETTRAPLVVEAPSADVAYHNILVPVLGGGLDHAAMVVACKVAAQRGATIVVAAVLEVPQTLPLNADLGDADWIANQQLDVAKAIGQEYGVDVVTRLVRARRSENAVLEEALRRESQLIVLGVHRRRHLGMSLTGKTNERILRKSPVRVLLVRERDDYLGRGELR